MYHYHLGIDLSDRAEEREAEYERLWPVVKTELTLEAITAFAKPASGLVSRMGYGKYSNSPDKIVGESVAEAVSDYLDTDGPRMQALMTALQSAADGKPEARLQAQAWIAAFAAKRAEDWCEEIATVRMGERA